MAHFQSLAILTFVHKLNWVRQPMETMLWQSDRVKALESFARSFGKLRYARGASSVGTRSIFSRTESDPKADRRAAVSRD